MVPPVMTLLLALPASVLQASVALTAEQVTFNISLNKLFLKVYLEFALKINGNKKL